jgi:hypothetical protein
MPIYPSLKSANNRVINITVLFIIYKFHQNECTVHAIIILNLNTNSNIIIIKISILFFNLNNFSGFFGIIFLHKK